MERALLIHGAEGETGSVTVEGTPGSGAFAVRVALVLEEPLKATVSLELKASLRVQWIPEGRWELAVG